MLSPSQAAQKWKDNLSKAGPAITAGVQNVTISPTELAARAQQKMADNVAASVASGKYAAACRKISTDDWKQSMLSKGINRIGSGATAAQPKMESFLNRWLPEMQAASDEVRNMPNNNLDDAMARVRKVAERGKRFGGKSF